MGDMDIYAAPQPLVVEELRVWGEEVGVARSCGIELQALGFEFPRRPLLGNRVNKAQQEPERWDPGPFVVRMLQYQGLYKVAPVTIICYNLHKDNCTEQQSPRDGWVRR